MRAFIAVELPADVRSYLARLQHQLAESHADIKWTEETNLHVTMRFLGEIADQQRQGIEELLRGVASRHQAVTVQLTGVGAFPSTASPRVVWVGIGEGKEALTNLAEEIEQGVVALGLPRTDHPLAPPPGKAGFAAHVTLGRVRSPKHRAQLVEALQQLAQPPTEPAQSKLARECRQPMGWRPPPSFTATHLTLFQSTLTSSGSRYTPLGTFQFV